MSNNEQFDSNHLREEFDLIDEDRDGFITLEEIRSRSSLSEAKLKVLVRYADTNGDGKIDFDEFVKYYTARYEEYEDEKMGRAVFESIDVNNDGSIDKDELRKAIKDFGIDFTEEQFEQTWKETDVDGDGTIDYDEFIKVWCK